MSFAHSVELGLEMERNTWTTQGVTPLGTRGISVDGVRTFHYAQAGATALKAHMLCITAAQGPGSTATDQVFYEAYAAGTTFIKAQWSTITDLLAADYLKDGYLVVNSTDIANNQMVDIHSNEALVSTTALNQASGIWLKKPGLRKVVATSTSLVKVLANPYRAVVVSTDANGPGYPVGVTPVAVAANSYFWLQTWGPALAHAGEGVSVSIDKQPGRALFWSTGSTGGVAGAMTASASGYIAFDTDSGFAQAMGRIGSTLTTAPAANFFHAIYLTLAP